MGHDAALGSGRRRTGTPRVRFCSERRPPLQDEAAQSRAFRRERPPRTPTRSPPNARTSHTSARAGTRAPSPLDADAGPVLPCRTEPSPGVRRVNANSPGAACRGAGPGRPRAWNAVRDAAGGLRGAARSHRGSGARRGVRVSPHGGTGLRFRARRAGRTHPAVPIAVWKRPRASCACQSADATSPVAPVSRGHWAPTLERPRDSPWVKAWTPHVG